MTKGYEERLPDCHSIHPEQARFGNLKTRTHC
jgi:hypothetical protein